MYGGGSVFEDLLVREDVSKILINICNSARYYNKKNSGLAGYKMYSGAQQMLFIFYDALYKYKLIINDMSYFSDFLEQVNKLIRKIDNFKDIRYGINRIIGRVCAFKLGYKSVDGDEIKEKVLRYIYDRYFVNGYYIHGYCGCYYENISQEGFLVEQYNNLYSDFRQIQQVLYEKNNGNLLVKDFSVREASFTDSLFLGCYYSVNAPMYFSNFLCKNEFIDNHDVVDAYSLNDYGLCFKGLNKIIDKLDLNDQQKGLFVNTFYNEWKLLNKDNSNINLMLVPRLVLKDRFNIEEFITNNKDSKFFDAVCKLLEQNENVVTSYNIKKEDIIFVNLFNYKHFVRDKNKKTIANNDSNNKEIEHINFNNYNKVYLLLLIGTLFIILGVVFTIIMFS